MSRPVKYIALALVIVLVGAAVTGIAFWTASNDPNKVDPGLYVNGKKVADPPTAITIGEYEVSFADYRHNYMVLKEMFDMYYGETLWGKENDPDDTNALILRDAVETELVTMYAWAEIAKEQGIELDEEDLAEIDATLAEQKETQGAEFEASLAGMYLESEEQYLAVTKLQKLSTKAQTAYQEKVQAELEASVGAQADADYEKDYLSAKHILIKFDEAEEDTEKAEADALIRIENILQQIKDSEDPEATFDQLMNETSEDTNTEGNVNSPEGYTFKEGDMVTEFYETAKATPVGEISDPVKSTYGYHIILRLPLADSQKDSNRTTAVNEAASLQVETDLAAMKEKMPVVPGQYYDYFLPENIV
ncbi:peptidylprolyl isomerase [Ruminococcaceae bacterium OttesenSCG-928-D13]|nr:peptidylprolyl isomerase [Ruminococcaceae bacterium OttesenSCG-928-D13]